MKVLFILLLSVMFIITSCHSISRTKGQVSSSLNENYEMSSNQIKDLTKKWERWYNEEQVDSLVSLYSPDAFIITTGKPAVFGKENIKAYYSDQFEQMDGKIEIIVESVDICSDVAVEKGNWNIEVGSNKYSGKYLTQWKMINGEWLTQLDVSLVDE